MELPFQNVHEFIGTQLINPLEIGKTYVVSFKASLAFNEDRGFVMATNKLGVLFSTVSYDFSNPAPINNFAHIYTDSIITDTTNWVSVSGTFIADSAYQYIIIGCFFDDTNVDTAMIGTPDSLFMDTAAYYFVDDVSIIEDTTNGITDNKIKEAIQIYPNPAKNKLFINVNSFHKQELRVVIYNSLGVAVKRLQGIAENNAVDISDLSAGIYFVNISVFDGQCTKRIIIY